MTSTAATITGLPARLARRVSADRAHRRLVRDFEALVRTRRDGPAPATGLTIGFATFGSGCWHLGLEALLAHALAQRGARPELLICDMPDLPMCDERTHFSSDIDRCAGCIDDKRALLDVCGVPWRSVSAFVNPDALAQARTAVAALDAAALERHEVRGRPLGQWLHVSACHFLRCDARGDAPEKVDVRRRLLASAIVIAGAVERWLDEVRPDIVIAESGAHFMWRIAMELARARGIPVVCREMGKGGWDRHIYALNADCMSPDLAAAWAQVRDEPLSADEQAEVDRILADLPVDTYTQKAVPARGGGAGLRHTLGVPAGAKVAVAFTNVTWDLATAGRDVGFTGVFDWIRETVRIAATLPGVQLVVRAHPAEASVQTRERILDQIREAWPDGLSGLTLIEPEQAIAARDLCAIADLVLVYNSTTGIEAAAHGHPVLVSGNPHYRGKGFTADVSSTAEYAEALSRWASGTPVAPPAHASDLARRYLYLFFRRYHVPMGWTTSPLEPPYDVTIRSLEELRPGRNAVLDVVCEGILGGRQILLPRRPPA